MTENIISVLLAGGVMLAVALVFGILLVVCAHFFTVRRDERIDQVENLLAKSNCGGCGHCAKNCPAGAIAMKDGLPEIDYTKCVGCRVCVQKCPRKCIKEH